MSSLGGGTEPHADHRDGSRLSARFVTAAQTGRNTFAITVDGFATQAVKGDVLMVALLTSHDARRDPKFGDSHRTGFCVMGACQDCWAWRMVRAWSSFESYPPMASR